VADLLHAIGTEDRSAFSIINPEKYVQHNLGIETGFQGILAALNGVPVGTLKAEVKRVIQDGDYVITHSDMDFFGPKVGFDIFRFEDGLIVEHWDNLQTKEVPNKSGRTMCDGASEVKDLEKTAENKKLAEAMVKENFVTQTGTIGNYMDPDFLQHNPHGADGMRGMGALMEYYNGSGNILRYDRIHRIFGEGNFVLVVGDGIYGLNGGVPTSFYDLFRFENGKVVEHWDVMEAILPEAQRKHSNGKFNFPQN